LGIFLFKVQVRTWQEEGIYARIKCADERIERNLISLKLKEKQKENLNDRGMAVR